jgi:cytochrome c-type biogenesis protein CcmH/NrfF
VALFPRKGVDCCLPRETAPRGPSLCRPEKEEGSSMQRTWMGGFLALALLASFARTGAQEPPRLDQPVQRHPEGDAAISRVRSPFCPGLMLEVCPSPQAKLLRDSMEVMAWNGTSSDSIVSWFLANHGEQYRAVPRAQGSGLLAWVIPPLALLAGLVILTLVLRHFRGRREVEAPVRTELSEEDESVLEAALEELKASEEVPF